MKQRTKNDPATLYAMHVFRTESLSLLERAFLESIECVEAQDEERISRKEFGRRYLEYFSDRRVAIKQDESGRSEANLGSCH